MDYSSVIPRHLISIYSVLTDSSPSTRRSTQVDQSSGFLEKLKFTVKLDEFEGGPRAIT